MANGEHFEEECKLTLRLDSQMSEKSPSSSTSSDEEDSISIVSVLERDATRRDLLDAAQELGNKMKQSSQLEQPNQQLPPSANLSQTQVRFAPTKQSLGSNSSSPNLSSLESTSENQPASCSLTVHKSLRSSTKRTTTRTISRTSLHRSSINVASLQRRPESAQATSSSSEIEHRQSCSLSASRRSFAITRPNSSTACLPLINTKQQQQQHQQQHQHQQQQQTVQTIGLNTRQTRNQFMARVSRCHSNPWPGQKHQQQQLQLLQQPSSPLAKDNDQKQLNPFKQPTNLMPNGSATNSVNAASSQVTLQSSNSASSSSNSFSRRRFGSHSQSLRLQLTPPTFCLDTNKQSGAIGGRDQHPASSQQQQQQQQQPQLFYQPSQQQIQYAANTTCSRPQADAPATLAANSASFASLISANCASPSSGLVLRESSQRRESFLYRASEHDFEISPKSISRHSSIGSEWLTLRLEVAPSRDSKRKHVESCSKLLEFDNLCLCVCVANQSDGSYIISTRI